MTSPRDPTQFTRESAERIANVVRAAELTPRATKPLAFDRVDQSPPPQAIKLARYTATNTWIKGTVRPVIFVTANTSTIAFSGTTATAINWFAVIPGFTGSTNNTTAGVLLSLQKIGGLWSVANAES